MNYYPHHIGDFNNATRHLTRVERSLYRDAIELYYDTESVLTDDFDKLSRKLLANTIEEKEALQTILNEFFICIPEGYLNERCEIELAKYRANTSNKAKAGIASALARKQKATDVEHVLNKCATNQEPITNNQEPITNIKNITPLQMLMAMGVSKELSQDWIKVRKEKKLAITQTALNRISNDAVNNGYTFSDAIKICCENGWAGFKISWVNNLPNEKKLEPDWKRGMI